ncbi:MAG: carboxymuconolactone decarboxylase family protein [Chloroflexi bacterium]|nr:carboxymuconolactone decarboxylase family protein [Chloroflexota bacterium]
MGYLPDVYQHFNRDHPELARLYGELADKCHEAGPLDDRTRRLVKLGIAVGLNSEGAVRSHTRRALEAGIPAAEVEHVIVLALTTAGFPTMIAAYKWAHEVIEAAQRQEPI